MLKLNGISRAANTIALSFAIALAIDTLCFSPPDSFDACLERQRKDHSPQLAYSARLSYVRYNDV